MLGPEYFPLFVGDFNNVAMSYITVYRQVMRLESEMRLETVCFHYIVPLVEYVRTWNSKYFSVARKRKLQLVVYEGKNIKNEILLNHLSGDGMYALHITF